MKFYFREQYCYCVSFWIVMNDIHFNGWSIFFKRFYLLLERGEGKEKEGEKHQCVVASHVPPTGDLAHNPGMCPGNRTGDPLIHRLSPLSYTSQGLKHLLPYYFYGMYSLTSQITSIEKKIPQQHYIFFACGLNLKQSFVRFCRKKIKKIH